MTETASTPACLFGLMRVDIVNSTGRLGSEGIDAALEDRRRLAELVDAELLASAGTVVAAEGDAVVAGFRSTDDAIHAGLRLTEAARSEAFELRVGATVGELIPAPDGTNRNDGVALDRVAAVEAAGAAGRVTIDDRARRALAHRPDVTLEEAEPSDPDKEPLWLATRHAAAGRRHRTELQAVMFTAFAGDQSRVTALIDVAGSLVERSGGCVIDTEPKGLLAVFDSCRSAVDVAADIHRAAAAANLQQNPGAGVTAAAALAVGEVSVGPDDRFGRPVVEASRLLPHAVGGTAMTNDVAVLAGARVDTIAESWTTTLKGFDERVEVHRIEAPGAQPLLPLPSILERGHRFGFTGRRDDLALLRSTWQRVTDGEVACVVIAGEEGAGKTRLASELAVEAFRDGAVVLMGSCDEELRLPYRPVADALRHAARTDPVIDAAIERGEGDLANLFTGGGEGTDAVTPIASFDLFKAFGDALGRLSQRRPVLLVLDDLQWATPDTVRMIEHLLSDPTRSRVMLLATCRIEDLDTRHPLQRLLRSSRPVHRVQFHRLDRLSEADVVALLESRTGEPLAGDELEFASQITATTGGSPLFIEELLVHLSATSVLVNDGRWRLATSGGTVALPGSVVELMSHRIARLDETAASVLAVAAGIGSSFTTDVVAHAADQSLSSVLDAVDDAASMRLVIEEPEPGVYAFSDEITRQAALATLGPARRSMLHLSIAEALEACHPTGIDALAHQWDLAPGHHASRKAVHYLGLAAERDMAASAWDSAIARLRRVVELLDHLDEHDDRTRGELHYRLGASLRMIGDEAHRPDLVTAAGCARRLRDGELLASAAIAMMRPGAWYPEAGLVDEEISAMCEDALALLDPDAPMRARVLGALATNLAYDTDADRRWVLVREAQASAAQTGDPALVGAAAAVELIACQEPDLHERRFELAQEVRRIGRSIGDRDLAFTGTFFLLLEYIARGDMDRAGELSEEVTEIAAATGGFWQRYLAAHFPTLLAIARCDSDVADVIEAERAAFEHEPVDTFGISVIQTAIVAMAKGTLSEMLMPFATAIDQFSDFGDWVRKWNFAIAKAHLDSGDLDAALDAIESQPDPDFDRYWVASMYQLGQLGLSLGRRDYCERVLRDLLPHRHRFAMVGVGATLVGQVSTALGQAALGLDDVRAAAEYFREAAEQAAALQFPFFATTARRFLATALLRADPDDAEARHLLDEVSAAAERHGFALELAEAAALREAYGL